MTTSSLAPVIDPGHQGNFEYVLNSTTSGLKPVHIYHMWVPVPEIPLHTGS